MSFARLTASALLSAGLLLSTPVLACDHDADAAENAVAKPKAGETVATFSVDGMHCAGCVGHVKSAVGKMPGVTSVSADFKSGKVTVIYNPKQTKPADIKAALAKAGFPEKVA